MVTLGQSGTETQEVLHAYIFKVCKKQLLSLHISC